MNERVLVHRVFSFACQLFSDDLEPQQIRGDLITIYGTVVLPPSTALILDSDDPLSIIGYKCSILQARPKLE